MGVRCQRQPSIWTRMAALTGSTNVISSRSDAPVLRFGRKKEALSILRECVSRIYYDLINLLGPISPMIPLIISHLLNFLKKYRKIFYRKRREISKKQ